MAVRLIVFDLDGTLLGVDNRLSAYSTSVLERANAVEGLRLMAASGRSRWAADLVLKAVPAVDWVICSNGAVLHQRSSRRILWRQEITPHVADLYECVNQHVPGACWAWETERGIVPDAAFRRIGETPGQELDELLASPRLDLPSDDTVPIAERLAGFGPVVRGLLTHPEVAPAEIVRRLPSTVPARISSSSAIFLEVTALKVHKGAMLERFCEHEGIAADDVVAFGDHMNDLEMLRWAGRGYAMQGAHPGLVSQVRATTERGHDDDGAAYAIEKLLPDR